MLDGFLIDADGSMYVAGKNPAARFGRQELCSNFHAPY